MSEVVSEPFIMNSPAGFYIGSTYHDSETPNEEMPYDRYTGYFPSYEKAEQELVGFLELREKLRVYCKVDRYEISS